MWSYFSGYSRWIAHSLPQDRKGQKIAYCVTRRITIQKWIIILTLFLLFDCADSQEDINRQSQNNNLTTVIDLQTAPMWAAADNGANHIWCDVVEYCWTYETDGYQNWRMLFVQNWLLFSNQEYTKNIAIIG